MTSLDDILIAGRGHQYQGYVSLVCPFHKSFPIRPSLMAWQDGWFQCLSCGKKGKNDYLLEVLRGRPVRISDADEKTDWIPPTLPTELDKIEKFWGNAHQHVLDDPSLRWYYQLRGVDNVVEIACLGWYNGWATIPIRSIDDATQGVILRAGPHIEKASEGVRFHQPRGQKGMMYCPDWGRLSRSNSVAIVFGMFDALAMATLGIPVVTPTAGKDSFQPKWLDDVWSGSALIIPDQKEEETAYNLRKKLSLFGIHNDVLLLDYPEGIKDPADFLKYGKGKQLEKVMHTYMAEEATCHSKQKSICAPLMSSIQPSTSTSTRSGGTKARRKAIAPRPQSSTTEPS